MKNQNVVAKKKVKGELVYGKLMTKDEQKMFSEETDEKLRDILIEKLFKRKGNALALKSRQQANGLFKSGNFREAIGVYNHTLTYTENHTADLGLCYANRAASFLKLNQYSLCLADIELAKKNKYPARLMPKLDRRQIECETLLAANGDAYLERSEPKLSFEADPKIPCFAKGLEVKFSEKYGKYITTNCDLEIGQTIIVERAFVFEATDTFYLHCEYCLKRTTNLIPCENCVIAMFCSENCRVAANAKFHDVLCDIQTFCEKSPQQILLLQSMIIAIRTFSTVAALMAAVERFRATNGNSTTDFNDPTKRDYFQFFNLRSNVVELTAHERNELKKKALEVIEIMKSSISLQSMFRTRKIAQFLSHLAVHHMQIITFNTYNASHAVCCPYESVLGIKECTLGTSYGIGLVPYSSQVSHSCAPNICRIFLNDTVVHKVLRQIKSGDQLFITYL